jgi:hypothetical protein
MTGGVDSKTHGLTLAPPKLQECVNAFADQTGSLQRRPGRTALNSNDVTESVTTIDWRGTGLHRGRLLGYTPLTAHEFSEDDERWVSKGLYNPWHVNIQLYNPSGTPTPTNTMRDMAVMEGFRCYVFDYLDAFAGNRTVTAVTIVDAHGTRFGPFVLANSAGVVISAIRVVAFGPRFYVVYNNHQSPNSLMSLVIDTSTPATLAAGTSTVMDNVGKLGSRAVLDLTVDPVNGPLVAYKSFTSATTIKHGFISTAGALVNTGTFTTALPPATIQCCSASDGFRHAFGWAENTAVADLYVALRTFSAGTWSAPIITTAIATFVSAGVIAPAMGMIYESDDQTLRVFWDFDFNISSSCIRQKTVTAAGVISPVNQLLTHAILASKPFHGLDGAIYYWVSALIGPSAFQHQLYLMRFDNVLFGEARSDGRVVARNQWNLTYVSQDDSTFYTLSVHSNMDGTGYLTREASVDMDPDHSLVGIEDGQSTILPGGFVQQYDGTSFVELGFLTYVELAGAVFTEGVGGNMVAGRYGYRVIPEWFNALGEREQGTDAGPVEFTVVAAAGASVSIKLETTPFTRRDGVTRAPARFAVYRTEKNPTAESPHHYVGFILNQPSGVDTVTFIDTLADATIATRSVLYADVELDHVAPGAGSIVAAGNGRVFVAGIPSDPNLIQYSKLRGHGQALSFNEGLTIPVPQSTGVITGLAVFAESLVIFTETAVYRVNGDGSNNTGTAGGFTPPVLVQTDCGALGQRSICVTPAGIVFESPKGKMLMQANFSSSYIGAPLEKLAEPGAPKGTTLIPALQQVRHSYAAITHVFDYFHGQWHTYTHGSEGPTALWREKLASPQAGAVHVEDDTVWTDDGNPYAVKIRLGWMHGASLRSDISVRKLAITGQALDNVNMTVSIAKDQQPVNQVVEPDFVPGRLMFETRIRKQVCSHLEITIEDLIMDDFDVPLIQPTAGFRLNEVTFELALRGQHLGREA